MQKDCFNDTKTPVVQFAKLDQNNKAEFLQFLIRNNITFNNTNGKQSLTAKVTLKNINNNKNSTLKSSKANHQQSLKSSINKSNFQQTKKTRIQDKQNEPNYHASQKKNKKSITKNSTPSKAKSPLQIQKDFSNNKIVSTSNAKINLNQPNSMITISSFRQNTNREQTIRGKNGLQNFDKKILNFNKSINSPTSHSNITPKTFNTLNSRKLYNNQQIRIQQSDIRLGTSKLLSTSQTKAKSKQNLKSVSKRKDYTSPLKTDRKNNKLSHSSLIKQKMQNEKLSKTRNIQSSPAINRSSHKLKHSQKIQTNARQKIRDKVPNNEAFKTNQRQNAQLQNKLNFSKQKNPSKQIFIIHNDSSQSFCPKNQSQSFQNHHDRTTLVNKYKNYFSFLTNCQKHLNSNTMKQRPICWPLGQLQRFLDQFYDDNFAKNTHQILNGNKRLNESLDKNNCSKKYSHISEALQKFMLKKFNKVQKVIQYNLINLLYSLAYYVNQSKTTSKLSPIEQNPAIVSLFLFQDFIMQKKDLQNYLFFLFIRNILKQDFKKVFAFTLQKCFINKKQIDRFLKHVIGHKNVQLLEQYHQMIFDQIQGNHIQINKFLKLMVDDYQKKRQAAEQSQRNKERNHKLLVNYHGRQEESDDANNENQFMYGHSQINHQDYENISLENTFHKILNLGYRNDSKNNIFGQNQHIIHEQNTQSMQQLTFGQDTRQMLKQNQAKYQPVHHQMTQGTKFWASIYLNQPHSKGQKQKMLKDQMNQMIIQRLYKKTKELVEILSNNNGYQFQQIHNRASIMIQENQNIDQQQYSSQGQQQFNNQPLQYTKQRIEELLFCKSMSLFMTVIEMNKVKWLKQLYITSPSQQDIQTVEEIQLLYRRIKDQPTAKDIAELCKIILTIPQITEELSKFFI